MTKVFLTGASGFIAKHILRELIEKGYEVRASVRTEKRKSEIEALFPDAKLEFAFLDLNKDEGWAEAVEGCDVLMHTASPFPLGEPSDPQELIRPAVDGTLRALNAAKDAGITRVVLTSSTAAIHKDTSKPFSTPSDERNWTTPDSPKVSAYEASKTLAERAAWKFVSENPEIKLTTINPGMVFGPALDGNYGASLDMVEQLMTGKIPVSPPIHMATVDVRDVATAHVAAINMPATHGERFALNAGTHRFAKFARILANWDPSLKVPNFEAPAWILRAMALYRADAKVVLKSLGVSAEVSGTKAEQVFGLKFIPTEDALIASAQSIRAHRN